jgi:hypothetical protein
MSALVLDRVARSLLIFAAVAFAIGLAACAPSITSLEPEQALPPWPSAPFPGKVAVEPLLVHDGGYMEGDADRLQQSFAIGGLSESLRRNRIFSRVDSGYGDEFESDLVIRGEMTAGWDPRASDNFATWFPGGLVLAPNWYGTRQAYAAEAHIDISVRATGQHLGSYQARTSHELVHRSGSPGPFFGAAIIVPNVMRGVRLAYPRSRYKQLMYPVAHGRLWDELAAQIAADARVIQVAAAKAQRARCGERLDRPPMIGQAWSKFVTCQSADFVQQSEQHSRDRITAVFIDEAGGIQVTVTDDRIIRLEMTRPAP